MKNIVGEVPREFARNGLASLIFVFAATFAAAAPVSFTAQMRDDGDRPRVELAPVGAEVWDFSCVGEVRVAVSNDSDQPRRVRVTVFGEGMSPDAPPTEARRHSRIPPHAVRVIAVSLNDTPYATDEPVTLIGMQWKPPALKDVPDFGKVGRIEVAAINKSADAPPDTGLAILGVETAHPARKPKVIPAASFFPLADRYGQFMHDDWPGKIHSDADLAAARAREEAWLDAHADGPIPDADRYGGWAGGPQLEATGFFRTGKIDGKWWFVDPEGHLFWSLGVCSVYPGLPTKVAGREKYFSDRADASDFWIVRENLARKYDRDFEPIYADMVHRRFRAWGLNTIGNWNQKFIWSLRRTPYCLCIDPSSKTVLPSWDAKKAHGRAVPDVDSPQFAADLAATAEKWAAKIKDDPWCLGVFVDNELGWDGCGEQAGEIAEKYYSTVSAVLKKALPNHLYLGSRIHNGIGEIPSVWAAASRHCDVVSNNHYDFLPSYDLPDGADDKPIMIGEFHFGCKGAGYFNGGLVAAFDAAERARMFREYAGACLDHPRYVGCHWFQYHDQPFTGRFDGENFQCGFASVTDTPHPELVDASRETASEMYRRRFEQSK